MYQLEWPRNIGEYEIILIHFLNFNQCMGYLFNSILSGIGKKVK